MNIQWPDQQTYVEKLAEHTQKLYLWCKIINVESSPLVFVSLCNNNHNNDTVFVTFFFLFFIFFNFILFLNFT